MKKALLQEKLKNSVKCKNCAHFCVLPEGKTGICQVRRNINGEIFVQNYQKLVALQIDPIEKKPLYHFQPGTDTLSIAAAGCSFSCKNCQNWHLSQKNPQQLKVKEMSPENIVRIAKDKKLSSISYTYGEPIIFLEYALDIMKLAKEQSLKNVWVSNGYFSKQSLHKVAPLLDVINIDLKSFSEDFYKRICGGRLQPVLDSIKELHGKVWLEITTLIIPGYNDSENELTDIADFIASVDKDIPWHISVFSGRLSKEMKDVPDTPKETIEKAYDIGKKAGLEYIYPGNIVSDKSNTYCPNCKSKIIERENFKVVKKSDGQCQSCGQKIKIIN